MELRRTVTERIDRDTNLNLAFAGLNLTASLSNTASTGTGLQGTTQAEIVDLKNLSADVSATFTVHREAAYNNVVGFYVIDDLTGQITDSTGNTFAPEDTTAYVQAALNNRIAEISLTSSSGRASTFSHTLGAGQILAPFLIVDGTVNALLDGDTGNDPAIYFPFLGANSDSVDHVRLFGNNTFGFEDFAGGGDMDFDDVIVQVEFA